MNLYVHECTKVLESMRELVYPEEGTMLHEDYHNINEEDRAEIRSTMEIISDIVFEIHGSMGD
jgi:hypothetical protein